ncbi:glycosyltransferase [Maricaulis sp. MIT060901]|uniref:glycosyltransferase n=1 Tax=Maricaulis sp. MIT060901 TaxID=3096993 RepID=UPI0039999C55
MAKFKENGKYTVVMAVMNLIDGDSRVLKTADTLHYHGIDVVLVGYNAKANRSAGWSLKEDLPYPAVLINGISRKTPGYEQLSAGEIREIQTSQYVNELRELVRSANPRVLHTHDMHLVSAGVIRDEFPNLRWFHDLHEWVRGLDNIDPGIWSVAKAHENQFVEAADVLFTVGDEIADIYREDFNLPVGPTVIHNAPYRKVQKTGDEDIRSALKLGGDDKLAVYCGQVKETRGVHQFIPVLEEFPDLHIAFVTNNGGAYVDSLREEAKKHGAEGRIHFHPYVSPEKLPHFLSSADFGFHTMPIYGNGDVALPNKLFEYVQAGIPVAVSNARVMREFVEHQGIGTCFDSENVETIIAAIGEILASPNRFKPNQKLRDKFCWENEEKKILGHYASALSVGKIIGRGEFRSASRRLNAGGVRSRQRKRICHGPLGSAGQPSAIAKALRSSSKRYTGESLLSVIPKFGYSSDLYLSLRNLSNADRVAALDYLVARYDAFHFHSASQLWSPPDWIHPSFLDLFYLKARGAKIVFHFRGTEVRSPELFAKLNKYSYSDSDPYGFKKKYNAESQEKMLAAIRGVADEICVVDPELQTYVPDSVILPRLLSGNWKATTKNGSSAPPLIVHAPSRSEIKGTNFLLKAVEELKAEGLDFEFELVEGKQHVEALEIYRRADIIVDQLCIGWYGVLAIEAMALQKATVVYIRDDLKASFGSQLPIIDANPDNIRDRLRLAISDRRFREEMAARGREFYENWHSTGAIVPQLEGIYDRVFSQPASSDPLMIAQLALSAPINNKPAGGGGGKPTVAISALTAKVKELKAEKVARDVRLKRSKQIAERVITDVVAGNVVTGRSRAASDLVKLGTILEANSKVVSRLKKTHVKSRTGSQTLQPGRLGPLVATPESDLDSPRARVGDDKNRSSVSIRYLINQLVCEIGHRFGLKFEPSNVNSNPVTRTRSSGSLPGICEEIGLKRDWRVLDVGGAASGGEQTLGPLEGLLDQIRVAGVDEKVIDALNIAYPGYQRVLPESDDLNEKHELIILSPVTAKIPDLLNADHLNSWSDRLAQGGYLVAHFVRDDCSLERIPRHLHGLRGECIFDENGKLVSLPDVIATKFDLISNTARRFGSSSFISWLVLRSRSSK